MSKHLIIGDIHGCYAELMDLLDRAGLEAQDHILAVGDMIDRGPDSARVLDFFRQQPGAGAILGNHERGHQRSARKKVEPDYFSQKVTKVQLGSAYPEAVAFLATLPRYRDLPMALVVHGFWEPGVDLNRQQDRVLIGTALGE